LVEVPDAQIPDEIVEDLKEIETLDPSTFTRYTSSND
jgi:hypothetical protein